LSETDLKKHYAMPAWCSVLLLCLGWAHFNKSKVLMIFVVMSFTLSVPFYLHNNGSSYESSLLFAMVGAALLLPYVCYLHNARRMDPLTELEKLSLLRSVCKGTAYGKWVFKNLKGKNDKKI